MGETKIPSGTVKSVQAFSITIPDTTTLTGEATILPVSTTRYRINFNGSNSNSSGWGFVNLVLTNATKITATRGFADGIQVIKGTIEDLY